MTHLDDLPIKHSDVHWLSIAVLNNHRVKYLIRDQPAWAKSHDVAYVDGE